MRADSFVSYNITGDDYNLIGIEANGDVAVESPYGCTANDPNRCYEIFSDGVLISKSDTLTNFTPDDGSSCSFTSLNGVYQAGKSVCDDGDQVEGVSNDGAPEIMFLSSTGADLATIGTADLLFVNGDGDFVVVDGMDDEIQEFMPTPEPRTVVLMLTAAIGVGVLLYRRKGLI